jgi:hypothetical protein
LLHITAGSARLLSTRTWNPKGISAQSLRLRRRRYPGEPNNKIPNRNAVASSYVRPCSGSAHFSPFHTPLCVIHSSYELAAAHHRRSCGPRRKTDYSRDATGRGIHFGPDCPQGWPEEEITRNYHLTSAQVRSCVAYASEA